MVGIMKTEEFFPQRPEASPMIYAYEDTHPRYKGLLKVGYTTIDVEKRVAQQYPTKRPGGDPYKIVFAEQAMYSDGTTFTDHDMHRLLRKRNIHNPEGEWFQCSVKDVKAAYLALKNGTENLENRTREFGMRPEQRAAVEKTIEYYTSAKLEYPDRAPKFLWNAKMRFGKTFASYQLAKKMGLSRVLVLTFKPAVESAWSEDLLTHVDFEGWQFICRDGLTYEQADKSKPFVCFASFQDFLGEDRKTGGIKPKNEWAHVLNWDIVIFDEYHFGAWRDNAKKLFAKEDEDNYDSLDVEKYKEEEADNAINESWLEITTSYFLFLSGTPFRALNSGEFIEDQIFNWTYSDEQRAKENWGDLKDNPYSALPRMVMMTYTIPDSIKQIALQGQFNEFDLNVFFSTKGSGNNAVFVYEREVQKWLDLIRGSHLETTADDLKQGAKKPPMPYSDIRLLNVLSHTMWFMPNVAACFAMKNLLEQRQNIFYHDYTVNVCAGSGAGIGVAALPPVQKSMNPPLQTKTITLSCGKLTTGVTVKPWTGIFILRNLSSPETYFQAAFRVQSPWEIDLGAGNKEIMKHECYVFDFALDRALKQIADYSCRLNVDESNPEKKVEEFINFLPVIAYDGISMRQISAEEILDIAMAGTSATLLAKRWESALLVNVDNETLARLMASESAMKALMSIEGFRSLNSDIETIIAKSDAVKKAKKDGKEKTAKEKKELTEEEKEFKSKRKQIQEKLIKFATRVPIFMYLTDYRERSLKDVITQLEPGLFKKVTGLDVKDFELLISLGVFNGPLMNDAIYKFKRYEDTSLSYTGINKHKGEDIGLWDTTISYDDLLVQQQDSLIAPLVSDNDIPETQYEDDFDEDEYEEDVAEITQKPNSRITSKIKVSRIPINSISDLEKPSSFTETKIKPTPEPIQKPTIDYSGVKVGSKILHKAFGEGVVKDIENGFMTVSFGKAEKRFQYPESIVNGFFELR